MSAREAFLRGTCLHAEVLSVELLQALRHAGVAAQPLYVPAHDHVAEPFIQKSIIVHMWDDDDIDDPVTTRAESLTRADKGKQEQRERKAAQKGKLNQLKLQTLRQRVDGGKADDETKRMKKDEKKSETFGTKTRLDEERAAIDTAQTKVDPDKMLQKADQDEAADKQAQMEEDKDQTG